MSFGSSSSLQRIGIEVFGGVVGWGNSTPCGIARITIPSSVRELCDRCFFWCSSLVDVTFAVSSSLKRIGVGCFEGTRIEEISIPDNVRELCDRCFYWCKCLRRVTFGSSSSLKRIGFSCFEGTLIDGNGNPLPGEIARPSASLWDEP